ncbi:MAG: hypothetical protein OEW22_05440 [Rubrivivax sp.]|nr:hypothetical protein [Rubrivivax sp.]
MSPDASPSPRRFAVDTGLPGSGLPHDRLARIAARRAFVDLKLSFMHAVDQLDEEHGRWLRDQVRRAHQPEDLLLLRGHVFACLTGTDDVKTSRRRALRRSLDSLFPDSAPRSGFMSF